MHATYISETGIAFLQSTVGAAMGADTAHAAGSGFSLDRTFWSFSQCQCLSVSVLQGASPREKFDA